LKTGASVLGCFENKKQSRQNFALKTAKPPKKTGLLEANKNRFFSTAG